MKKQVETSKKLAWFSGVCFAAVLIYGIVVFSYVVLTSKQYDFSVIISLVTTSGAVFGATCVFYYNKSKSENLFKIKRSFLKLKYLILKNIDLLDTDRVKKEIEHEFSVIEDDFDDIEKKTKEDIAYKK